MSSQALLQCSDTHAFVHTNTQTHTPTGILSSYENNFVWKVDHMIVTDRNKYLLLTEQLQNDKAEDSNIENDKVVQHSALKAAGELPVRLVGLPKS